MKKAAIAIILLYRNYISPSMLHSCRFYPTCSQYMIDAINKYGLVYGIFSGFCRIVRCNPLSRGGYDPA